MRKNRGMDRAEVHDLLKLNLPKDTKTQWDVFDRALPEWAMGVLKRTPWVVVRRGQKSEGIPVGIRGDSKQQRFGCVLKEDVIEKIVTPEQAFQKLLEMDGAEQSRSEKPWNDCLDLLRSIANKPYYKKGLKSIGIGGSAGFEIATGCQVTKSKSDLDLLLKISKECDRKLCIRLWETLKNLPVRADAVLVTDLGWISLEEYVCAKGKFLVKTTDGCCMSEKLW